MWVAEEVWMWLSKWLSKTSTSTFCPTPKLKTLDSHLGKSHVSRRQVTLAITLSSLTPDQATNVPDVKVNVNEFVVLLRSTHDK